MNKVSLSTLKALIEKKTKKKILIKMMWNEREKITLFITPNMKINSFIYDEKEGYLFYDTEGKPVEYQIPCIVNENELSDGKVSITDGLRVNNLSLSNDDIEYLREYQT